MEKHKFASISLTVQDRAIFVEILDPQVIWEMYYWQFSKKFPSPKMASILYFPNFCQKNGKTQSCFYLLNHAR